MYTASSSSCFNVQRFRCCCEVHYYMYLHDIYTQYTHSCSNACFDMHPRTWKVWEWGDPVGCAVVTIGYMYMYIYQVFHSQEKSFLN